MPAHISRPRFLRGATLEEPIDAPVVPTARLTLRPHRMSDADEWFAIQSSPEVVQFLSWPERDRKASRLHLRDRTLHTRLYQADDFMALAVELDGRLIGDVSLHLRIVQAESRSLEMSWLLNPAFSGRGYATEAGRALLDFAFGPIEARWVTALVDTHNHPSLALARRLGLQPVSADDETMTFITTPGIRSRRFTLGSSDTIAPDTATFETGTFETGTFETGTEA